MIPPFKVLARNYFHLHRNFGILESHQLDFLDVGQHCMKNYLQDYDREWNFIRDVLYQCYQILVDLGYLHWLSSYSIYELVALFHPDVTRLIIIL